jgi:hypothetical protein
MTIVLCHLTIVFNCVSISQLLIVQGLTKGFFLTMSGRPWKSDRVSSGWKKMGPWVKGKSPKGLTRVDASALVYQGRWLQAFQADYLGGSM